MAGLDDLARAINRLRLDDPHPVDLLARVQIGSAKVSARNVTVEARNTNLEVQVSRTLSDRQVHREMQGMQRDKIGQMKVRLITAEQELDVAKSTVEAYAIEKAGRERNADVHLEEENQALILERRTFELVCSMRNRKPPTSGSS